jgi:hypothetical protein
VMASGAKALAVAIAAPLVIGYAVTQAPQIEITSTSMAHTQQGAIEVKGRVKKRRIAQVFLDVNGYRQPVPVYDQTFRATVPLVPGLNKIRASADKGTWHLTGTSNPIRVVADIPVTYERRAFVEGRWVRVGMGAPTATVATSILVSSLLNSETIALGPKVSSSHSGNRESFH